MHVFGRAARNAATPESFPGSIWLRAMLVLQLQKHFRPAGNDCRKVFVKSICVLGGFHATFAGHSVSHEQRAALSFAAGATLTTAAK